MPQCSSSDLRFIKQVGFSILISLCTLHFASAQDFEDDESEEVTVIEGEESALSEAELAEILAQEGLVADSTDSTESAEEPSEEPSEEPAEAPAEAPAEEAAEAASSEKSQEAPVKEAVAEPTVEEKNVQTSVASGMKAKPASNEKVKRNVGVFIASTNKDATIYVNGKKKGTLKARQTKKLLIPAGAYNVTLKSGGESKTAKGTIKALRKVSKVFRFKGAKGKPVQRVNKSGKTASKSGKKASKGGKKASKSGKKAHK